MNDNRFYLHKRPSGTKAELQEFARNVLKNFFDDYFLDDSLDMLWKAIQQSFYSKHSVLKNYERTNLIIFHQDLHALILASSIVNEQLKQPA